MDNLGILANQLLSYFQFLFLSGNIQSGIARLHDINALIYLVLLCSWSGQ